MILRLCSETLKNENYIVFTSRVRTYPSLDVCVLLDSILGIHIGETCFIRSAYRGSTYRTVICLEDYNVPVQRDSNIPVVSDRYKVIREESSRNTIWSVNSTPYDYYVLQTLKQSKEGRSGPITGNICTQNRSPYRSRSSGKAVRSTQSETRIRLHVELQPQDPTDRVLF